MWNLGPYVYGNSLTKASGDNESILECSIHVATYKTNSIPTEP